MRKNKTLQEWDKPILKLINLKKTRGGDLDIDNESFLGITLFGS